MIADVCSRPGTLWWWWLFEFELCVFITMFYGYVCLSGRRCARLWENRMVSSRTGIDCFGLMALMSCQCIQVNGKLDFLKRFHSTRNALEGKK